MKIKMKSRDRLTISWLLLSFCLMCHVTDEALNDFLGLYNPLVLRIKESLTFLPVPTFTFKTWIIGLLTGILILFLLTPAVTGRKSFVIPLIRAFSILMILNGCGHILGSIYYSKIIAGMITSPFLIVASIGVLYFSTGRKTAEYAECTQSTPSQNTGM